jgi:hypothetical protein
MGFKLPFCKIELKFARSGLLGGKCGGWNFNSSNAFWIERSVHIEKAN